ncbi:primase topoisomerase-like protein [Lentilactobacillus senioris DSM 24302 = JCM 17472]|uniref:Ribonuclease M5 n=1 Tax=Lentilactobacillus senioris DSM 24302 = JCM 17472 TaxID=1423802 RepID=A0A0R2CUF8_9LACO|nr:ribonuclease M5 [Lentilactobacillus senioris]KRM94770.1 primase topoisomerase-like protein [Lentilactobacillus senioris DSM 24302 = JCM 17472]
MKRIKEVIVVEGKDDTKRIQMAVDADTIETRGSAIPDETLELIEQLAQQRGIIIFTDPDFSGEKIRKTVAAAVPNAKHAFLRKDQAVPDHKGSLGVEHASSQAIIEALSQVYTEDEDSPELISQAELITAGLMGSPKSKHRRQLLGERLGIGYVNGKQLQHRLRMFGITPEVFETTVKEIIEEERNE